MESAMSMSEDEWVKQAMVDDSVVVRLLLKLSLPSSPPPPPQPVDAGSVLRVKWSVRQRRSRQVLRKKGDTTTRASPTTPLSWSGATATSVSGGGGSGGPAADGFEESSLAAKPVDTARSKVAVACETPIVKRSRKKKTLSELKDEENLQLKERRNLREQLQYLQSNLDKQRAENESLKRLKLDFLSRQTPSFVMVSVKLEEVKLDQSQQTKVGCDPRCTGTPISAACNESIPSPPNASTQNQIQDVEGGESSFLLPDLNLPVEDDSSSEFLYGMS